MEIYVDYLDNFKEEFVSKRIPGFTGYTRFGKELKIGTEASFLNIYRMMPKNPKSHRVLTPISKSPVFPGPVLAFQTRSD